MSSTKIKVGILFGGNSREREVAFAGGRTVYDNLDKKINNNNNSKENIQPVTRQIKKNKNLQTTNTN